MNEIVILKAFTHFHLFNVICSLVTSHSYWLCDEKNRT